MNGFRIGRFFSGDRRHVDGVGNGTLDQVIRHLLGNLQGDIFLRFRGRGAQMRRADDVGEAKQRAFGGRLDFEHVKAGTGDMAGLDGFGKSCLIHQTAAGAVDDAHALLGLGKRFLAENAAGLVGHRHMQGDEIGLGQQLVELDLVDAHFLRPLLRQEGVIGNDMHLQADGARADDGADIAGTDDAERLAGDLDAHEFRLFPLAGLRGGVGGGSWRATANISAMACSAVVMELPNGVFMTMIPRLRGGRNIDIVDADAGAADDLEIGRSRDQLFGRLGGRADGQTIIIADDFEQLFLVLAELRHGNRLRRRDRGRSGRRFPTVRRIRVREVPW